MHYSSSDDRCAFIRGSKVRKMHTSRRDAFRPINDKPIAFVDENMKIKYNSDYDHVTETIKDEMKAVTGYEAKVALVKVYPNADPSIIDYYVDEGYKGIIIEGTGLGHVPSSGPHKEFVWLDSIRDAVKSGVIVGMTSQCLYGRVNDSVYRNLRLASNSGAIYCEDMTAETALVKLAWLLGNHSREDAKRLLNVNMAGEIKSRSEPDEFLI